MKEALKVFPKGFISSYSQLFFADSKVFAWLLALSSFVSPTTGLSGVIALLSALFISWWIRLDHASISQGVYSYSALMLGLVLGSQYDLNWQLIVVLVTGAFSSVLFTSWFLALFAKYKLPVLSLAFLLSYWIISLGIRGLNSIEINESGIFRYNEWYRIGGNPLVEWMTAMDSNRIPGLVQIYLKSLSAIFFQYNIVAGSIILIGLILWSRIGFLLSLLGFAVGYLFYYSLAGDFSELSYSYIGFNFILSAIAIGGFYTVPSRASFLLAIITMPLIALLIGSCTAFFSIYQLQFYSLPFVITVLLTIMLLQQRTYAKKLALVTYQYFSPETNLYRHTTNLTRFKNNTYVSLQLPFYGEWHVSQGYKGKITHLEDWENALDFVVQDEVEQTYKVPGTQVSDFYCYNLPVLAPADGYITEVADGIEDNDVNDVNLSSNWGNTVVIKHADGLFTKLAHLRKNSITVKINDFVKAGQVIGTCGNSGRSPEPHIHFQAQATSFIGSKTLAYPLAYYVSRIHDQYFFHSYNTPEEGTRVHNPAKTPLLTQAFHFTPGQQLKWLVEHNGKTERITWECRVNAWNQSYLYCLQTNAVAYYINNGTLFYFTGYTGSKKTLLFDFYIAAQKILLGYYHQMQLSDALSPDNLHSAWLLRLHDFAAPFYRFLRVSYESKFTHADDPYNPGKITITTKADALFSGRITRSKHYELHFSDNKLAYWKILNQPGTIITCTDQ